LSGRIVVQQEAAMIEGIANLTAGVVILTVALLAIRQRLDQPAHRAVRIPVRVEGPQQAVRIAVRTRGQDPRSSTN
jgi:hypothetical protein